jgi:hypothetical protein
VDLQQKEGHVELSPEERQKKLERLAEFEGFGDVTEMLEAASFDSVNPGICVNSWCDYTAETEPDQREGHCEACGTKTVQAALVLAELV